MTVCVTMESNKIGGEIYVLLRGNVGYVAQAVCDGQKMRMI